MLQSPKSGYSLVGEYQVSPVPFATASLAVTSSIATNVPFPYVTSNLFVTNTGTSYLALGFTSNGVMGSNRVVLAPSGTFDQRVRIKDLYLVSLSGSTTANVYAGLTFIERRMSPVLTGSAAPGVYPPLSSSNTDFGYPGLG
jgi:hypothetical protein